MPQEVTALDPLQEQLFQRWVHTNGAAPGVRNWAAEPYDMRGFWQDKEALAQWKPGDHFPDTYKEHEHPTFSTESQYSRGVHDGGQWLPGDTDASFVPSSFDGIKLDHLLQTLVRQGVIPRR